MKKWYFTFGISARMASTGAPLASTYVEVEAENYMEAREIMISWFGVKWAFQYDENLWHKEVKKFYPTKLKTLYEKNTGAAIEILI